MGCIKREAKSSTTNGIGWGLWRLSIILAEIASSNSSGNNEEVDNQGSSHFSKEKEHEETEDEQEQLPCANNISQELAYD
jgi:hypothetical protein